MTTPTIQQTDSNPFTAYRDPATGRWHVVVPPKSESDNHQSQSGQNSAS